MELCCSNASHEYESIDPKNYLQNKKSAVRALLVSIIFCTILAAGVLVMVFWQDILVLEESTLSTHKIMHITDAHIDLFFDPMQSASQGACHSCSIAKFDSSNKTSPNNSYKCPSEEEVKLHVANVKTSDFISIEQGNYLFGRYGCDPPLLLWSSLLAAMQLEDSSPPVVVFTGKSEVIL